MPEQEIPNDDNLNDSQGSSLSSTSSLHNINVDRELIINQRFRPNSADSNSSLNDINNRLIIQNNDDLNPNNDEEFYNPNQPYLFPVQLPHQVHFETTLDVLLRNVTGRSDLQNVHSIKLRVISASVSLYTLSVYMPNLTSLNLEGSVLSSLRDLGYNLHNLTFLNVSNCGLTSLDGTSGFPSVEMLIADKNMIQLIGPIQNLMILKKLSLKENQITNLNWLTFLGACTLLEDVDLRGNPVIQNPYYRITLKQSMPNLKCLDGITIDDDDNETDKNDDMSTDDNENYSPSTLSDDNSIDESLKSDLNNSLDSVEIMERPSTSNGVCLIRVSDNNNNNSSRRPSTATTLELQNRRKILTSGPPICGSITSLIRKKKLNGTERKTAWKESSDKSSSSSFSSENSFQMTIERSKKLIEKNFPERLPQTNVDLSSSEVLNIDLEKKT
ncbi:leucine-rich repeat-containing protein 9 [Condylostylus longicornis]|uniref:leucine-rich repeat-containing protein 9 n=1 Tax=Condylostylus longicornis TaxID=2530218 RepID=UPI00244E449A|nr:leucine-rich repeat-containing protein 9 [Condylostylus longicornis]